MNNQKMATEEYASLRNEMIARIEQINTQANSAWTTILAAWTICGTMIILPFTNAISNTATMIAIDIIVTTIFFLILLLLLPMAVKSGENIKQIMSLSCYIRVFHKLEPDCGSALFRWESANSALSLVNVDRGKASDHMKLLYNQEYAVLAFATIALYLMSSTISILNYATEISRPCLMYIITFHLVLLVIDSLVLIQIHLASSIKRNMHDYTSTYIEKYSEIALHLGLYPSDYSVADIVATTKV